MKEMGQCTVPIDKTGSTSNTNKGLSKKEEQLAFKTIDLQGIEGGGWACPGEMEATFKTLSSINERKCPGNSDKILLIY